MAAFVVVAGFCLLLLHNNLYYGHDFPIVLVSSLVLIPLALFQCVRLIVKKRPLGSLRGWKTLAALVALALTLLLLRTGAPGKLGWQFSKAQFENAAREILHDPGKAHSFQRRLGLYQIREAAVDPESGAVYFLTPYGMLDAVAFVRLPSGAKIREDYVGGCRRWDGDWEICSNEPHGG